MTERLTRVSLLTGAGASRPLGLPTMEGLLPKDFNPGPDRDVFDMALNWAAMQDPGPIDFEHVFTMTDTIAKLHRSDPAALAFAPRRSTASFLFRQQNGSMIDAPALDTYRQSASALAEKLKDVVHKRLEQIDQAKAATLYQGLFSFLRTIVGDTGQIDLFTTNYDRAVEASYQTLEPETVGFDFELINGFVRTPRARAAQWDPGVYERPPGNLFIVKLYKLHGSLDWRRENTVVQEVAADEYVGRNVVIYPVRKPIIEEPFKTLFDFFKRRLRESSVSVIIGSSLRDDYIRQALVERVNAEALHLVLIDPNADQLAARLESEVGRDRCTRFVHVAKGPFGGSGDEQTAMEGAIRSAAIQAEVPPPVNKARGHMNAIQGQKRADLLAYATEQFREADSVRLVDEDVYDPEIIQGALELRFRGVRVLSGFTRELWDHTATFAELRAHMETYGWREVVDHSKEQQVTLGEKGWIESASWK